jgi:hypothetical protein
VEKEIQSWDNNWKVRSFNHRTYSTYKLKQKQTEIDLKHLTFNDSQIKGASL